MAKQILQNEHGFYILRESKYNIEATARISPTQKFLYQGPCAIELKNSVNHGWQVVISVWQKEGQYPILENPDYTIKRGRIEICVPLDVARIMRLAPKQIPP